MSADLATLERKVEVATLTFARKFDLVLAKLDEMHVAGKPGMTQSQFAKLLGVTPRTISRRIKAKKLRLEKGLIPNSEVRKHLS
jgi:predicted transcriptional regulator